nr:hypothetical protein [Tanacetum cinerariifolium]
MMDVLWNPTIKKSVGIVVPNVLHLPEVLTFIGFRFCPNTSDPMLVKISTIGFRTIDWEVEVFKLSTRVWKTVSNISRAFRSCDLTWEGQVCVGGFIYWLAYDDVKLGRGVRGSTKGEEEEREDGGGQCGQMPSQAYPPPHPNSKPEEAI